MMNKLSSNAKKGFAAENFLFIFYRFIIVCMVAFALLILVRTYIVTQIDIQETHAELFIEELILSKNGVSYYDPTILRTYPGIISANAFTNGETEQRINSAFSYGEQQRIAAELQLMKGDETLIGTIHYNKEWYDRWIVLAETGWIGKGGSTVYEEKKQILLLYDDGTKESGTLLIKVVMPNS